MPPAWAWFLLLLGGLAILGYLLANLAWLLSLRHGAQLSSGSVLFATLAGIGATLIGLLVYHERVSTLQAIGMLPGIGAIALLSFAWSAAFACASPHKRAGTGETYCSLFPLAV